MIFSSSLLTIALLAFVMALIVYVLWINLRRSSYLPSLENKLFCEVDGVNICYEQIGTGHDLVLIHGIGASTYVWRLVKKQLAEKYRLTLIDLPGFGYSDKIVGLSYGLDAQAARVCKFLRKLGIQKATVVGSSMGGAISLRMSQLAPQLCSDIILLNPATNRRLAPAYFEHFKMASRLLHLGLNPIFMYFVVRFVHPWEYKIDKELLRECLGPFMTGPESVHCFLSAFQTLRDARMPQIFSDVQVPVLILWGQQDRVVTRKYMLELQHTIKNSTLVAGPTAGHHPQEDDFDWTLSAIFQFLDRQ